MEWILLLIGIAYSLWSSFTKEQRDRHRRQPERPMRMRQGVGTDVNEAFRAARVSDQREPAGSEQPVFVRGGSLSRAAEEIRKQIEASIEEVFEAERGPTDKQRRTYDEASRYEAQPRVYDEAASYDARTESTYASEHGSASHFKHNEGLRKDTFQVSAPTSEPGVVSSFAADVYEKKDVGRKGFVVDRSALRSYIIMHEVLSKPKYLRRRPNRGPQPS